MQPAVTFPRGRRVELEVEKPSLQTKRQEKKRRADADDAIISPFVVQVPLQDHIPMSRIRFRSRFPLLSASPSSSGWIVHVHVHVEKSI